MKHQEKKLRVKDFSAIEQKLKDLGASEVGHAVTTHYYARQDGNDVIKLVHYETRDEIHELAESNATFTLINTIPIKDIESGLKWLKDHGHHETTTVKMDYTEYSYKGGLIGLCLINDSLYSVILDFPPAQHKAIQNELGLDKAEVIDVPYNKYLEKA